MDQEPRLWLEVLISARMGFEPFDGEMDPGLLSNAGKRLGRRDKHFVSKVVLIRTPCDVTMVAGGDRRCHPRTGWR